MREQPRRDVKKALQAEYGELPTYIEILIDRLVEERYAAIKALGEALVLLDEAVELGNHAMRIMEEAGRK